MDFGFLLFKRSTNYPKFIIQHQLKSKHIDLNKLRVLKTQFVLNLTQKKPNKICPSIV